MKVECKILQKKTSKLERWQ